MKLYQDIELILANSGLGPNAFVRIVGKDIPRSLLRSSIFAFPALCSVLQGIICVNSLASGSSYASILYAVCLLLTFLSALLIYSRLIINSDKIGELFAYLENLVSASKSSMPPNNNNFCL